MIHVLTTPQLLVMLGIAALFGMGVGFMLLAVSIRK